MAAAALEARCMAEGSQRRVGDEPRAAKKEDGGDKAEVGEGERESLAAVVSQRSRSNAGGDSRSGGVHDGIAAHGDRQAGLRTTTQEADWPDVRPHRQVGDGGAISQ